MTKSVRFNVGMTCGGCKGAVVRILGKIEGVQEIDADVETKVVVALVEDGVSEEAMLGK
jgi:copper chaperone